MILYFSGTGNSRYAAILLAKTLDDEILSINELISSENFETVCSDKPFIFVVPTYCYHIPSAVEEYISKTEFKGNNKAYFVMTCGAGIGGAGAANRALCKEKGLDCMGTYTLVMPDNYLVMYEPSSREEAEARLAALPGKVSDIAEIVKNGGAFDEKSSMLGKQISILGSKLFNSAFVNPKKFSVMDACISCGSCVKNCPLNNISLSDGKPVWSDNCIHCLSCLCGCPQNAVEYGKGTKGRRRHYVFPDGTLKK